MWVPILEILESTCDHYRNTYYKMYSDYAMVHLFQKCSLHLTRLRSRDWLYYDEQSRCDNWPGGVYSLEGEEDAWMSLDLGKEKNIT